MPNDKPEYVNIRNNQARLVTLATPALAGGMAGTPVQLRPGDNPEIPRDAWNAVLETKSKNGRGQTIYPVRLMLETPIPDGQPNAGKMQLEVVGEGVPGELSGLLTDGAIGIVRGVLDVQALRRWRAKEARPSVVAAIEEQLKLVASAGAKPTEDTDATAAPGKPAKPTR